MKLDILKESKVGEIKTRFASRYPFLKLEFFTKTPVKNSTRQHPSFADDDAVLSQVQPLMREGCIAIYDTMKVKELEDKFLTDHRIEAQVFRRSGNIWLETTMTDAWTLARQNTHGKEITEHSASPENNIL